MRKSRIPTTQKKKKKGGESLTLKCWEIQAEPNFSLFGIPEVKPYIQCHPEKSKGKPGLCSRHSCHKTPVFKGYGRDTDNNGGQPSSRNFYTIDRLDIVLLPKYQRNSASLAWLRVHITVIPCLCHLPSRGLHQDVLIYAGDLVSCFTKKKPAYLKHSWKPHSFWFCIYFFVVKLVN